MPISAPSHAANWSNAAKQYALSILRRCLNRQPFQHSRSNGLTLGLAELILRVCIYYSASYISSAFDFVEPPV